MTVLEKHVRLTIIIAIPIVLLISGLAFFLIPISEDVDEELPTITITGTVSHWKPIDGFAYAITPENNIAIPMDNGRIYLSGSLLNSNLDGKQITVTGQIIENYVEYQISKYGGATGGDPSTSVIFVTDIVNLDEPQVVIEEEGILLIKNTIEYKTLIDKYGEDIVSVKAVNLLDSDDAIFLTEIDEGFRQNPGCIIVLEYKNNEGYIYQLDEELSIVHQMDFLTFAESAKNVNSQVMTNFYSSLK